MNKSPITAQYKWVWFTYCKYMIGWDFHVEGIYEWKMFFFQTSVGHSVPNVLELTRSDLKLHLILYTDRMKTSYPNMTKILFHRL